MTDLEIHIWMSSMTSAEKDNWMKENEQEILDSI